MNSKISISRRDFLKLLALAPASYFYKAASNSLLSLVNAAADGPGVIIIVLDTLSASNMSLYGYPRKTTTNIERFARRSNVYHAHYSAANFTSSGTASLLTGLYPWTHRAFHYEGQVVTKHVPFNLFRYWGDTSLRLGYTQNAWTDLLLYQFSPWIDRHVDLREFSLDKTPWHTALFHNDPVATYKSVDSTSLELTPGFSSASFLALLRKVRLYFGKKAFDDRLASEYPHGIPKTLNDVNIYFLLEDLFDGLMNLIGKLPPSALTYLHLFPPHYPYAPRAEFADAFKSGWQPDIKPPAQFIDSVGAGVELNARNSRALYDAYIATVDTDFGRLLDFMEHEGILDRNYVVLTSDHGDLYERGVLGHTNEYLYEPLIRIPLIISGPGQTSQVDIHTPTSSVDVLPTLLALTGRPVPDAIEGQLLPGLGGNEDPERSIFSIDSKGTAVYGPIRTATFSLRKGQYKLIGYYGYEDYEDIYELFDLKNDPGEIENLTATKPEIFSALRAELDAKLREINAPYAK